uniref:Uncharacterized protein n=1 Tax=Rhizobium leguminosarum TaxID=384 RepID=A0A179BED2_RHILE|nr:hypothetical protein A4U53_31220 [Rhizobium leguminosarum]
MNGRILVRCIGALASSTILWCAASPLQAQDSQRKPNILFIVSDDTGYGDLGPYGGGEGRGMPTPNIDKLADEGMTFFSFGLDPTRAAVFQTWFI